MFSSTRELFVNKNFLSSFFAGKHEFFLSEQEYYIDRYHNLPARSRMWLPEICFRTITALLSIGRETKMVVLI